jgi:protein-disulfide isomerase-like protein with CxxC motif
LADFEEAGQMDAHGFPTLLLHTGTELITVAAGYLKADHVLRSIKMFVG